MSSAERDLGMRSRRAGTALWLLGLFALCASAADALWLRFADTEKSAHYLFGYWFDAVWSIQVPLLILGVLAIAAGFFLQRGARLLG